MIYFTRCFIRYLSLKQCAEFSWSFVVCVLLIISLWRANLGNAKSLKVKIFRDSFILKKISASQFEFAHILVAQISWKLVFAKKHFFFFLDKISKKFCTKNNVIPFFKYYYFILQNIIFIRCLKKLFRKIEKKW